MDTGANRLTYFLPVVAMLTGVACWAGSLNDGVLRIHAAIVPKTALMDYNFRQKLVNGQICIAIICMKKDTYYANNLKKYIKRKYSNGLSDLQIKVTVNTFTDFLSIPPIPATIYYLLPAPSRTIRSVLHHLKGTPVLVFTYDPADLRHGAHISVRISYSVKPVINLSALKDSAITLRPAMIKISELFTPA